MRRLLLPLLLCACASTSQSRERFTDVHREKLAASIAKTSSVASDHQWRDVPAYDGELVNAYIEIPRGTSDKYEFDLAKNERVVDRVLDPSLGGYPTNYGFIPQTMAFDGDPYDVLVLGPPLEGGTIVKTRIVALMHMDDEKGPDPKLVLVPVDTELTLDDAEKKRIATWFDGYKKFEPDKWAKVTGWSDAAAAKAALDSVVEFYRVERSR
ncbi:MAG: inorganic diphosphatase [Deltaproteobacteria bacterium]